MGTEALLEEANRLVQAGEIVEGLENFQQVLTQEPENVQALAGIGVGESMRGNHLEAIQFLQNAHAQSPQETQILINLGHACMAAQQFDQAYEAFEKAFLVDGSNAEICYWLAYLMEQKEDLSKAESLYRQAIEMNAQHRQAYLQLSNMLFLQDKQIDALAVMLNAEAQFPNDRDVKYVRGKLAAGAVPAWHLPMLKDQARNDAYEAAIKAKVKPNDIVLDIGTGSGLLAMMAARAGAKHVYACEAEEILATLAREIIARNGLQDKITVIAKHSSELVIGEDLPQKADVLVSEILDSAVIGEGVLPTMDHAWRELLTEEARVIPENATLYGALTECPHLQCFNDVGTVNGFDLSPMNVISQPFSHKDAQLYFETSEDCRILSEKFLINTFDFKVTPELVFETKSNVKILEAGNADSILFWFDLTLADGITYSTENSKAQHHWRPASQVLLEQVECTSSQNVTVTTEFENYFDFKIEV